MYRFLVCVHYVTPQSAMDPNWLENQPFRSPPPPKSPTSRIPRLEKSARRSSITEQYVWRFKIRNKLMKEAAKPNHCLRTLIGHANLFDSLLAIQEEQKVKRGCFLDHTIEPNINSPTNDLKPLRAQSQSAHIFTNSRRNESHAEPDHTDDASCDDSENSPDSDSSTDSEYNWVDLYFQNGEIGITNAKCFELDDQL